MLNVILCNMSMSYLIFYLQIPASPVEIEILASLDLDTDLQLPDHPDGLVLQKVCFRPLVPAPDTPDVHISAGSIHFPHQGENKGLPRTSQ